MKAVPRPAPAPAVGVRAALADHDRAWVARTAGGPWRRRLAALEAGEAVVVSRSELPAPWRSEVSGGLYELVRIEADGELTPVRPLIFVGTHWIGGAVRVGRHSVDHVPVGTDGDRSDIVVELDEVRRRVADPESWSL